MITDAVAACVEDGWSLERIKQEAAQSAYEVADDRCDGDLTSAARMLKVSRRALQERRRRAGEPEARDAAAQQEEPAVADDIVA